MMDIKWKDYKNGAVATATSSAGIVAGGLVTVGALGCLLSTALPVGITVACVGAVTAVTGLSFAYYGGVGLAGGATFTAGAGCARSYGLGMLSLAVPVLLAGLGLLKWGPDVENKTVSENTAPIVETMIPATSTAMLTHEVDFNAPSLRDHFAGDVDALATATLSPAEIKATPAPQRAFNIV